VALAKQKNDTLIIAGGLFDYLPNHFIIKILKNLKDNNLNDCGKILFTNISPDNPDRAFLEYLVNWILAARTEKCLLQLAIDAGFSEEEVKIKRDTTGISYIIELKLKFND